MDFRLGFTTHKKNEFILFIFKLEAIHVFLSTKIVFEWKERTISLSIFS